jgi:hypothetical protein
VKRSEALAPLSRDHHQALAVALVLSRADADTVEAAVERFAGFWKHHGGRHFDIEERVLLGALDDSIPGWADACRRVRTEHADIRRRADALLHGTGADPTAARDLGGRLRDHVRFEERESFTLLERELPDDALTALGEAVRIAEAASSRGA